MNTKKILVLAANPWDTKRLGVGEELREIREVWKKGIDENKFEVSQVPEARIEDLLNELQKFKPNIVHFSGHGEVDNLLFSDDPGNTQKLSRALLVDLFSMCSEHVHCVVLNACNSEQIAEAISQHIDCAIGMSAKINDIAAVKFATGFYRALFNGYTIKEAYKFAKWELNNAGYTSQQDIPVLYPREIEPTNIQAPKKFLPNYQYDVLIHAASSEQAWAEQFKNVLQNCLSQELQELKNTACYLHLQTDNNIQLEQAALSLFIVSEHYINEYKANFTQLINPSQKQFVISRSETCPNELSGLSRYQFYSEKINFSNSPEFQELATVIAKHLQNLKKEYEYKINNNPFSEHLVFIHTEPTEEDAELAKHLQPLFKTKGLACAITSPKYYKVDVKSGQKNCEGVLIVYGKDYSWARERIEEYHSLKQHRKKPLKIVMIHADCSKEIKDTLGLEIYNSVPVFSCPPKTEEELIKRFEDALNNKEETLK